MNNTIECKICGFFGKDISSHIKNKHKLSTLNYKNEYKSEVQSDFLRNQQSLKQKAGSSILTKLYWIKKGMTEEDAINKVKTIQRKNNIERNKKHKPEWSIFNKLYWIKKGMTEEDAINKVKTIQSTLSKKSPKFSGHIRSDDEKKRISTSMINRINKIGRSKWASHFGKFSGRSKLEIQFYEHVKKIKNNVECNVSIGNYIVDVIVGNKIIEFYGDHWHANPKSYIGEDVLKGYVNSIVKASDIWKRDEKRIKELESMGYSVMIVWELDWNKNKEDQLELVKNFLL